MATDDVVADLPPASKWTFRQNVPLFSLVERTVRRHAPVLNLARDCVARAVTRSRILGVLGDTEANASFIKQAQMVAFDPAKAELMVPVLSFYANAHHRSNIEFPPFVAAFAVELFRYHSPLIGPFVPDDVYDVYSRLGNVMQFVVMAGTPVSQL